MTTDSLSLQSLISQSLIKECPSFVNLCSCLTSCSEVSLVWEHAKSALSDFLVSSDISRIIQDLLVAILKSSYYLHPASLDQNILLFDSASFAISLVFVTAERIDRDRITSPTSSYLLGLVGRHDLPYTLFGFPTSVRLAEFCSGVKLDLIDENSLKPGNLMHISHESNVLLLRPHVPTLAVKVASKISAPIVWVFDRHTLTSLISSSSTLGPSHAQMIANMLKCLHANESEVDDRVINQLLELTFAKEHFVRWSAMSALCSLDFDAAEPRLLEFVSDPHPEIQLAANKALDAAEQAGFLMKSNPNLQ